MTAAPPKSVERTLVDRNDLLPRLASAIVLAPVALAAAYFGGWPASLISAAVAAIVMLEWLHIVGRGLKPGFRETAIAVAASAIVAAAVLAAGMTALGLGTLIAALGAVLVTAIYRDPWRGGGVIYAATFGISLLALRHDAAYGLAAVTVVFAVAWATDSAAFFAGRLIGGPKLWPEVSPKKTWSGFWGGFATGTAAGIAAIAAFRIPFSVVVVLLVAGLAIAVQLGDLFESALKRRFGLKDAGRLIPGHGGLMDRVDGLIFASFAAMCIGLFHKGPDAIATGLLFW
ncbi:MAG: phosphatidate cytidylyltransferase [Bauldia sp.]